MTDVEYLKSIAEWFEMNRSYDRLKAACVRDAIEEIEAARVTTPGLLSACRSTLTVLDAVQGLICGDDETEETLARILTRGKLRGIVESAIAKAVGELPR